MCRRRHSFRHSLRRRRHLENACSIRYMQIGQKVSGPRDGVRLAGACRMLNQVLANRSLRQHSRSPDHQNGGARVGTTRRCARATSHFYGPQRKQSPSPGRGGGLTTAVAGCRSHGFELVRADRSLITGACRRCWMKSDDRSARSVLVVLFRVASGAGPSPLPPSRNLVCDTRLRHQPGNLLPSLSAGRGSIRYVCYRVALQGTATVSCEVSKRGFCSFLLTDSASRLCRVSGSTGGRTTFYLARLKGISKLARRASEGFTIIEGPALACASG